MGNLDSIRALLAKGIEQFIFSGYQVYIESPKDSVYLVGGRRSYWGPSLVSEETLFDIGSVTKAVVTTSLVALLVEKGKWKLSQQLGSIRSDLAGTPYGGLQLGELLSHSSGLLWWAPIFREQPDGDLLKWLLSHADRATERPQRQTTVYSDLNFLLLGLCLETFDDLKTQFVNEVAKPLGLKETVFGPLTEKNVAATEYRNNGVIQGRTFDENCESFGGVSAHAGLFSTARDLSIFTREWLKARQGKSEWLSRETAELFTKPAGYVKDSTWAFGWDTKSPSFSSCGDLFHKSSFGHLGFPGCSLWIDPENEICVSFLSNRVHPSRLDERIKRFRPELHNEIAKVWGNRSA